MNYPVRHQKTGHLLRLLTNRSGQAAVEYVLILIITLTLLLLAKNLFSNMNNFVNSYVGGYFYCLMDYGELPSLGVSDKSLSKHTAGSYVCKIGSDFSKNGSGESTKSSGVSTPISKAAGAAKKTIDNRSGTNTNGRGKNAKNSNRGRNGQAREDSGSGGDGEGSGFRSSSSPYASGDAYESSDTTTMKPTSSSGSSGNALSRQTLMRGVATDRGAPKSTKMGIARIQESRLIDRESEGPRLRKRLPLRPPPPKEPLADDSSMDDGMSFGKFFKWLMILGIGIILFILFGSQILNYSKSDSA